MADVFDVFLSYNRQDKLVVEGIGVWLKAQGLEVWLDKWELRPGFPWQEGTEGGIRFSRAGAVFVGSDGLGDWQTPEMWAFIARSRREQVPVIPVLLPGCPDSPELPLFLEAYTGVDLRRGVSEEGMKALAWGITGVRPEGLAPTSPLVPVGRLFQPPFLQNLPYPTLGPLFQGREIWLENLHQSLAERPSARATAIAGKAVHGLGGVGKTRLAVEYAWRHTGEFRAAFFVVAGSRFDLRRSLAALASPILLNLPEREAAEEEIREAAVLRWLRTNSGWLLILDNVDTEEAAQAVDALLAQLQGGHVLLTGRITRWSTGVEAFELDLLEPEAAVTFLLARTQGRRRPAKDDWTQAAEIARELGYLPLALEQVGAYVAERRLTLSGYLEDWLIRRERVLEWFDSRLSHYPASLAMTWQTSVDLLSDAARQLLERLAWLGPEPIPESLLESKATRSSLLGRLLPFPRRSLTSPGVEALVELETYSLVTRSAEAPRFTVHRLVQDVTRLSLQGNRRRVALAAALACVDDAFVGDVRDVRTWSQIEPLAPHVRAVTNYGDQAGIFDPTARLINDLGLLYGAKALFSEAEPLLRRALAIVETSHGPQDPVVANGLNNLAALLRETNRLTEAEPLLRRAVAINEKSLGPEHSSVAESLFNLTMLLKDTNRLAEAEPLMRRALAIYEKSFGSEHPRVALSLNNLAQLLQDTNRLDEAEVLTRKALAIDEKHYGLQHPAVALDLSNLAGLLYSTDRVAEAEPLMRRALVLDEKSYGAEHPFVAIRLNNLARILQSMDRLTEAEPLLRRSLAIVETCYEPEHADVATPLNNLALLLKATKKLTEAQPLFQRVLEIFLAFERRTGFKHPHLNLAVGNYSSLLSEMGRTEAEIARTLSALTGPSQ